MVTLAVEISTHTLVRAVMDAALVIRVVGKAFLFAQITSGYKAFVFRTDRAVISVSCPFAGFCLRRICFSAGLRACGDKEQHEQRYKEDSFCRVCRFHDRPPDNLGFCWVLRRDVSVHHISPQINASVLCDLHQFFRSGAVNVK